MVRNIASGMGFALVLFSGDLNAQDTVSSIDSGLLHTVWLGICAVLVLLMQLGFLLVEGGLVRSKNAINVILKNLTDIGLGTVGYWLIGFGVMFGTNPTGWFGTDGFFYNPSSSAEGINLMYQMMFAATAATIISGAIAERTRFLPYIIGALFVTTVIYPVFGSWVWGGSETNQGWLAELGFHDMAGAAVVHAIGGFSALGALVVIGPRTGRYSRKGEVHKIAGHNLPFMAMGVLILWFGWFGFNGGAVSSDLSNLGQILINTHMGAVGGILGSILILHLLGEGFRATHIGNGVLGGLVSITGGADVYTMSSAFVIGILGGVIVVVSRNVLHNFKIDDVVGAVSVHGFCGIWGVVAVAFFHQSNAFDVLTIVAQLVGACAAFVWAFSASLVVFWLINKVSSLRVGTRDEQRGLDVSEHKEIGYSDFMTHQARADY